MTRTEERPNLSPITTMVEIRYDWADRLRILLGRPARLRVITRVAVDEGGIKILSTESQAWADPLLPPRKGGLVYEGREGR